MSILRQDVTTPGKRLLPSKWTLKTATGESARVRGETIATFQIGGTSFKHRVLVANIEEEVILGMDMMTKLGCKLDLEENVIRINGEEIVLQRRTNNRPNVAQVVLDEDTVLPERCQKMVPACLEINTPDGQIVMLEPGTSDERLGRGIFVAKALIRTRKKIPIRVMNINDFPVTLKKGCHLGRILDVSSVIKQVCHTTTTPKKAPVELEILIQNACQELTDDQSQEVRSLIYRYQNVFEGSGGLLGRTNIVQHRIDTGDARPIRQAPRRLPLAKREEAEVIVQDMEQDKIIEPSDSPWTSPVVLVKKKDGTTRFCVDYRRLNDVTKKDSYPLPRIDDTLDTLAGCKVFSTLDLKSGYWQVELDPRDKEKTAFSTGTGLWQFNVMPFGLCNAPATFERLMENILRGLSWETCLVYLDDIIVLGKTFKDQLRNLEQVFQRLQGANLRLNPKKCNLFRSQVNYLGHVVSGDGIAVDPEKIRAVVEWPVPKDKHEIRSFLGLCTYYRRFVLGFADIAKPLTRLTEDKNSFVWDLSCRQAFEELKKRLVNAPILSYPRPEGKFVLDTDASNVGIGSVLSQIQDNQERVIGYFSKVLSKPERNYCVTRRELLAVVKSVENFRKYLYGRKFKLRTDHAALMWLLRFKNPEGQVARWIERLQEYDFDSEHRAGVNHNNADALSRRPCSEDCKHCSRMDDKSATVHRVTVNDERWEDSNIAADQRNDPDLQHLLEWQNTGHRPTWEQVASASPNVKSYWAQWDSIEMENGVLKRALEIGDGVSKKLQLLVPKIRVPEILKLLHSGTSGGHLGITKTLEKVRERFYWVNCKEDVKDWCRKCVVCATSNGPQKRRKAPMRQYNVGSPFERIAIDISGPFPTTDRGNKYILVAMDYFSKWVEAYAIPNQEAITVAETLVAELVSRFGVPLELHSDQGRNFESLVFQQMCDVMGIKKTRTTALHPQSDGMVERMNRTIGRHLAKVTSDHQRDWDRHLPLFLLAYRSAVHETTGQTPGSIVFGRELRLPCDLKFGCKPNEDLAGEDYVTDLRKRMDGIHERVRANIQEASNRMKERYDVKAEKGGFQTGDLVWLFDPRRRRGFSPKLQRSWDGPYEVLKRINDVIYKIKRKPCGKPRIVHFNRLCPYLGDNREEHPEQFVRACRVPTEQKTIEEFMRLTHIGRKIRHGVTSEVQQDLFELPVEYALAHCVARDHERPGGIAKVFRHKFGGLEESGFENLTVGRAVQLTSTKRPVFCLVTKESSREKSNYRVMWDSLVELRDCLLQSGVSKLGIPKMSGGPDGLDWKVIRSMIEELFQHTGIEVIVCCYHRRAGSGAKKTVPCYFFASSSCNKGSACRYLHSPASESVPGRNSFKGGAV